MLSGPLAFYTVAQRLQAAIEAALTTPVEDSRIIPGSMVWDKCDCGILVLSPGPFFLTEVFPAEVTVGQVACDATRRAANIVIQVIRCAPALGPQGQPPTAAAQGTAAALLATDAHEAVLAVQCELADMVKTDEIDDYLVRAATPQGPSGSCVGVEFTATVGI